MNGWRLGLNATTDDPEQQMCFSDEGENVVLPTVLPFTKDCNVCPSRNAVHSGITNPPWSNRSIASCNTPTTYNAATGKRWNSETHPRRPTCRDPVKASHNRRSCNRSPTKNSDKLSWLDWFSQNIDTLDSNSPNREVFWTQIRSVPDSGLTGRDTANVRVRYFYKLQIVHIHAETQTRAHHQKWRTGTRRLVSGLFTFAMTLCSTIRPNNEHSLDRRSLIESVLMIKKTEEVSMKHDDQMTFG